jgi:hypothetical protein
MTLVCCPASIDGYHAQERDKLKATHTSHGTPDRRRVTAFAQGERLTLKCPNSIGLEVGK